MLPCIQGGSHIRLLYKNNCSSCVCVQCYHVFKEGHIFDCCINISVPFMFFYLETLLPSRNIPVVDGLVIRSTFRNFEADQFGRIYFIISKTIIHKIIEFTMFIIS